MADVIPFKCWRPRADLVAEVAAAPYDTFSRHEAAAEIAAHPHSFLRIDKSAALLPDSVDEYDPQVYARAQAELEGDYAQGVFVPDSQPLTPAYFIYRLAQGKHVQTGIMACASVADYQNGVIKRHENTRALKENDRVQHIKALAAHTGPVLLTYPSQPELDGLLAQLAASTVPLYDFVAPDGVRHVFWRVEDEAATQRIHSIFGNLPALYIADGHHRAAAAVRVAEAIAAGDGGRNRPSSPMGEAAYFLVAIFGSNEMQVLDYNRIISNLAGHSAAELLTLIADVVDLQLVGIQPYHPRQRGEFGMYLDGNWYSLKISEAMRPQDAVEGLDIAILHSKILAPLLQITDPSTNPNIAYVGGARGLEELATRANSTNGVAFAVYPCSLDQLFAVANANRLMPPKSTWFEPKPRSGLAIHRL